MDTKSLPDSASADSPDLTCVVCGDKANGMHYRALTCEGCKTFFRRNARHRDSLKCEMMTDQGCEMDMYTRRHCAACRMKKCISVGMQPERLWDKDRLATRKPIKKKVKVKPETPDPGPAVEKVIGVADLMPELISEHLKLGELIAVAYRTAKDALPPPPPNVIPKPGEADPASTTKPSTSPSRSPAFSGTSKDSGFHSRRESPASSLGSAPSSSSDSRLTCPDLGSESGLAKPHSSHSSHGPVSHGSHGPHSSHGSHSSHGLHGSHPSHGSHGSHTHVHAHTCRASSMTSPQRVQQSPAQSSLTSAGSSKSHQHPQGSKSLHGMSRAGHLSSMSMMGSLAHSVMSQIHGAIPTELGVHSSTHGSLPTHGTLSMAHNSMQPSRSSMLGVQGSVHGSISPGHAPHSSLTSHGHHSSMASPHRPMSSGGQGSVSSSSQSSMGMPSHSRHGISQHVPSCSQSSLPTPSMSLPSTSGMGGSRSHVNESPGKVMQQQQQQQQVRRCECGCIIHNKPSDMSPQELDPPPIETNLGKQVPSEGSSDSKAMNPSEAGLMGLVKEEVDDDRLPLAGGIKGQVIVPQIMEIIILLLRHMINFAKQLPGFQSLTSDDQATLIKGALVEYIILTSCPLYDIEKNQFNSEIWPSMSIDPDQMESAGFITVIKSVMSFAVKMHKLALSEEELALLFALAIMSPDRRDLGETAKVEELQQPLVDALQTCVQMNHSNKTGHFAKIIMLLTEVRNATEAYMEDLMNIQLSGNKLNPLLDELFNS